MCGRFTLTLDPGEIKDAFDLGAMPEDWQARFNVAPSQPVASVVDAAARDVVFLRWGLVPMWAKDSSVGNRMINARAETIVDKPAFRQAFTRRRCLILADGFFEWQRQPAGRGPSIPYYFRRRDRGVFAFAGLWESWRPAENEPELRTCTIITTQANELVRSVHDRMPVILDLAASRQWLAPLPAGDLLALLAPFPANQMISQTVGTAVNSPAMDGPQCVQPVEPPASLFSEGKAP